MAGISFNIPNPGSVNLNDVDAARRQAEQLASQAQQAAERAEQISRAVQAAAPPAASTSAPAPITQTKKQFSIKDYAIPIAAVAVLVGVGFFMWRQK